MLRAAEPPFRQGFCLRQKTLVRRTRARGPEGPLGDSPTTVPSIQNIDFYRPFQNESSFFRMSFHFGFRPPKGGLHPSVFECSGRRSRPSAKVFACGQKRLYGALAPRAQKGRWEILLPRSRQSKISIFYRPFQNERSFFRMSFHFGFRPPEAASTLRYLNAQGGGAALPPRFLPAAKTLVRRTRAAAQKGRRALLAAPF